MGVRSLEGSGSQLARGAGLCGHLPTRRAGTTTAATLQGSAGRGSQNLQKAPRTGHPEPRGSQPGSNARPQPTRGAQAAEASQGCWGGSGKSPSAESRESRGVRGMAEGEQIFRWL